MSETNFFCDPFEYGDCHVHTSYTDGKNSVFEYCQKAKENNLKSILFSEHVRKDISYDYADFLLQINKAKCTFKDLKILSGCEAKVLNLDGDLDVPDTSGVPDGPGAGAISDLCMDQPHVAFDSGIPGDIFGWGVAVYQWIFVFCDLCNYVVFLGIMELPHRRAGVR